MSNGWDQVRNLDGGMRPGPPPADPWSARTGSRPRFCEASPEPCGPLVFAHRGASADLPEHTLAAYLRALDEGADGLECDVRLTRDGHLVCVHDRRLDRTSNGTAWSARTLAELRRARLRLLAPGRAAPAGRASRTGRHPHPAAHPGRLLDAVATPAARPAADRDQAPVPLRPGGRAPAGGAAAPVRAGRARPDDPVQVTVMSFSAAGDAPRPATSRRRCPRCSCWRCCRPGCRAGPAAVRRPDRRARGRAGPDPRRGWCPRCGRPATRSTSGR